MNHYKLDLLRFEYIEVDLSFLIDLQNKQSNEMQFRQKRSSDCLKLTKLIQIFYSIQINLS